MVRLLLLLWRLLPLLWLPLLLLLACTDVGQLLQHGCDLLHCPAHAQRALALIPACLHSS
jgi:hypothetical protein